MARVKTFDQEKTLEKAMELFWEKGYFATSMQDLVDHLKINRASLYATYGDKKELFSKAFQLYRTGNIAGVKSFLDSQDDARQGIKALFNMAIEDDDQDPKRKGCFVVNTATELIPGDDFIVAVLNENKEVFEEIFYNYLKKNEEKGQFEKGKDLRAIASLLFVTYNGLKVVSKFDQDRKRYSNMVSTVLTLLD
ncbi:MAG: TetR/AcrR family transcriptional regulator [Cryomorphaceae bacterium]